MSDWAFKLSMRLSFLVHFVAGEFGPPKTINYGIGQYMPDVSFDNTIKVSADLRYRAGLIAAAALGAAVPGAVLTLREGLNWTSALALGASLLAVLLVVRLTAPLRILAQGLRDCLVDNAPPRSTALASGAGGMLDDFNRLEARLESVRQRLAQVHPASGLPTREPFLAELATDMQADDRPVLLAVVRFADFDRLTAFDHAAAERALHAFAQRLKASLPPSRPLAQVERDCFAAWFSDCQSKDAAARELQALSYVVGQELVLDDLKLTPEIAIGVAVFPDDGLSPAELLMRAICALDGSRQARNKVSFFSAQTAVDAKARFAVQQDLRGVVSRNELMLNYQPVVDLDAGRVIGAEALLRWNHPLHGLLAPGRFIHILEHSPMMHDVGLWVLNAACRQLALWRDQGIKDFKIAVNLSTTQCRDPRLTEMVMRTLDRHDLPASSLELELTETAALEDVARTRALLSGLRARGVSVALDDFGAGHANLSYLKSLPFSKLKIDREFVTKVDVDRDGRAICAAIIALARGLEISVLGEGVETLEEIDVLHALGCRLFQGYYFARPLAADVFAQTLHDPAWLSRLTAPRLESSEPMERKRAQ
jgi:EAL domain-containing protein (putative c-di-GMP-specific phosphodiesterase class I)/GGDEF domain-containing protein